MFFWFERRHHRIEVKQNYNNIVSLYCSPKTHRFKVAKKYSSSPFSTRNLHLNFSIFPFWHCDFLLIIFPYLHQSSIYPLSSRRRAHSKIRLHCSPIIVLSPERLQKISVLRNWWRPNFLAEKIKLALVSLFQFSNAFQAVYALFSMSFSQLSGGILNDNKYFK